MQNSFVYMSVNFLKFYSFIGTCTNFSNCSISASSLVSDASGDGQNEFCRRKVSSTII